MESGRDGPSGSLGRKNPRKTPGVRGSTKGEAVTTPVSRALAFPRAPRTGGQPGVESENFPNESDFVSAASRIGDLTKKLILIVKTKKMKEKYSFHCSL